MAALAPAAADAASFKATVVAKDAARQTLVTADRSAKVRTLDVGKSVKRYRVGQRVVARGATAAGGGSYSAKRVKNAGRAARAKVRAAVVQRARGRLIVSAGNSTFALAARPGAVVPGDIVVADVALGDGGATGTNVRQVGEASVMELEGIFLGLADGRLELAVERRGRVFVTVPAGLQLEAVPGDEVELVVTVDADGSFVLVALDDDSGDDRGHDHGFEIDIEEGEAEVDGVISAISADSVTVEAGGPSASVTCAIPAGVSVAGFEVGDRVELSCELVDGAFEFREMDADAKDLETEYDPEDDDEDEGDERDDR